MTNDALSVVAAIFSTVFQLFNSWYIPGTNVTPAVALFGILFLTIVFRILSRVFDLWDNGKDDAK